MTTEPALQENSLERRLLVPVDGSTFSSNALSYLAELFTDLEDIHLHLMCVVPYQAGEASRQWLSEEELLNMVPGAKRKMHTAKRKLDEAVLQLGRRGIAPEQVTIDIRLSRQGAAKDILQEARKGLYDALVIGRRGLGKLQELIMGSVSAEILEKSHDIPIWVIDGRAGARKILVPVDGHVHSLMAADHLAFILKKNPYAEITLFHFSSMVSHKYESAPEEFHERWGKEWCDRYLSGPDGIYLGPKQILLENGFPEERMHWFDAGRGLEPARQILRQARIDKFGTIVMGRRGSGVKKGLLKRVSDRVIFMAEHLAIWIVG